MNRLRLPSPFVTALALGGVLLAVELGGIYERFAAERADAARLAQKRAELASLATVAPAPTRAVAEAVANDLARAQRSLVAMEGELEGRGPAAVRLREARVPAARTDAYFDLATFVERARELARKNEVEVRPEAARFGFAAYANEAPDFERLEAVFRQRQVTEYLLESLLEAHPRTLLAVKRERPLTKKEREERMTPPPTDGTAPVEIALPVIPSGSDADAPDIFALDPRLSVRAPGFLDATAFRVVFIGQTAALRTFLNRLASFELPVVVREVEVEPVSAEEAARVPMTEDAAAGGPAASVPASIVLTASAPAANRAAGRGGNTAARVAPSSAAAAPLVTRPVSKFTVTIEYIELVREAAPTAEAAPAAG